MSNDNNNPYHQSNCTRRMSLIDYTNYSIPLKMKILIQVQIKIFDRAIERPIFSNHLSGHQSINFLCHQSHTFV